MGGASNAEISWILGSSRSGSTWLLQMLGELDCVATIDDPHIGHHLGPWRPISLAWAASDEEPELQVLKDVKRDKRSYFFNDRYESAWRPALRELIAVRFGAEAEDACPRGRRGIVVKEPGSQSADLLLSLFPGSKLVFLLRDGRDVVDSWIDAYDTGSWAIEEGAFEATPEGREALVRWLARVWAFRTATVRQAFDRHDPDRRILVRYEDLLTETAGTLQRICATTGLAEPSDPALTAIAERHRFTALPDDRTGAGKEQRSASPGQWRDNLTPREQAAMDEVLGAELERSGYSREPRFAADPAA
ncbi:MAG TPA: sulfotransferase [Solirubrobacterales bacterium]|nr:sulfotransferase [Solirubrobacterales bacterium]